MPLGSTHLFYRLGLGELVAAVDGLLVGLVEPDQVGPVLRCVEEVWLVRVAVEVDRDAPVVVLVSGHVADRVAVLVKVNQMRLCYTVKM